MYKEGDVEQVLLRLGIDANQRNSELTGYCPMHLERVGREDSNPSWSINVETGVHHCFSCGYKGSLLSLVADINEFLTQWGRYDYDAAKDWLRSQIEVDFEALKKHLEELRNSYVAPTKPLEMSEARLAVFTEPIQEALDARALTAEACELYGVKWELKNNLWITPIREPKTFKLLGWQEKGQKSRTFRNRPMGVVKSSTLFGIDTWKGGTMIIVESPLDAVHLASCGYTGGLATFGASISEAQIDLMRMADRLIIAFDNPKIDAAGEKASKAILSTPGLEPIFFSYGDLGVKDIGDMTAEMIGAGLENAKHCVYGEKAIYS
jgi:DNA primase